MVRTQIYIPDDLHLEATLLANAENKNFSTLVREGLADVINRKKVHNSKKRDWSKFIGAYKGPVKTNAVEDFHDYYRNFGK